MTAVVLPHPVIDHFDFNTRAEMIGREIAGPAADDVDRLARFPIEATDALRADKMLSLLVPERLGGEGAGVSSVASIVAVLARHCASTAMIYAMHSLQVACLVRHASSERLESYLQDLVSHQYLLASATTEIGTGGDTRASTCAVVREDGQYFLQKQAPTISYGEYADAILVTARRSPDSPPSDQALVLCTSPDFQLQALNGWDTLGLRGTCSSGFTLSAKGDEAYVLTVPFGDISAQTMQPVSHILWSHVWLGIATEALDRARRSVQAEAHRKPGVTPPAALRLAELAVVYDQLSYLVHGAAKAFEEIADDSDALSRLSFTVAMNSLKVSASSLVVDIVSRAMNICGIAGYRSDSPYSMGRLLRDAFGASLMINNDRILTNNAQLLMMNRGI